MKTTIVNFSRPFQSIAENNKQKRKERTMNHRIFSTNLFRILIIVMLVIPLALGATSPAKAAYDSGEIITWGYNGGGHFTTPSGLTDVIAIDAGDLHNLALRSDGTVVAWGENFSGQLDVPADLSDVVAIAAGAAHSLALKSDGTVVAWGENAQHQTEVPSDLTDVVAIGAGMFHNLARKSDGTFVGWGNNGFDQITFPAGLADVVAFDVGQNHNLAIKPDGTVIAWGYNVFGETDVPAGLADVVAVAAGRNHSLALKSDGTVVAWGNNTYGQTNVPAGLTGVIAIAAGGYHSLALKNDGTVVGWGRNDYGQSSPPSTVSGATGIYAGDNHSIALVPQIVPQVVYDNFDDNVTDSSLWSVGQTGGPVAAETNQRLEITLPANSAGDQFSAAYYSACQLRGDFDIQVDYELLTWSPTNGVRLSLNTSQGNIERASFGTAGDFAGGPEVYLTDFAGNVVGITATSDRSGKLRLERVGNTLTGFYFGNGGWITVGSYQTNAEDAPFALSSWSHDPIFADQQVKLAFDNMIINAGELVCPPSDATAPTITLTTPAEGAVYLLGQTVNADYACQEEADGSGLASCVGTVPNGSPIDTSSIGEKTFTVGAADNANNTASVTRTYRVIYNFTGFFQPVDNWPTENTMKAGASVPIKFSLGGNMGLAILAPGSPTSSQVNCSTSSAVTADAVEETITSNSGLTYDAASGQYVYVWKTNKTWANKCRVLTILFADGSSHQVLFKFNK
jgi:hypothetical protein